LGDRLTFIRNRSAQLFGRFILIHSMESGPRNQDRYCRLNRRVVRVTCRVARRARFSRLGEKTIYDRIEVGFAVAAVVMLGLWLILRGNFKQPLVGNWCGPFDKEGTTEVLHITKQDGSSVSGTSNFHWCPVKYFANSGKPKRISRIGIIPPKTI